MWWEKKESEKLEAEKRKGDYHMKRKEEEISKLTNEEKEETSDTGMNRENGWKSMIYRHWGQDDKIAEPTSIKT